VLLIDVLAMVVLSGPAVGAQASVVSATYVSGSLPKDVWNRGA